MTSGKVFFVSMGLAVTLMTAGVVSAQGLDPASAEALSATLRMLTDPSLRNPAIATNPQAGAIDQQVQAMVGAEPLRQEFYALSAQIFEELTRNSGGDVRKMSEALERAKSDPAAFAAMLSPATLQRLRELSIKISDQRR
ncbi:MAG: hypothetical protein HYV92_04835 [Candidatus Rokubacteria bacterium]|nr:hypothetical protein [Candidatus Rokubacteria bacterium]MBI2553749.1 hypothetical protein [Candidatus Rokubacteria bacterium]